MSSTSGALIFEDIFLVRSVDSSRFENVVRIRGKSTGFEAELTLDVHGGLFPIKPDENISLGLTCSIGGEADADTAEWMAANSMLEDYDYSMYGRVFKIEDKADRRTVYTSFGGLIMALSTDRQVLAELQVDLRIFALLRRSEDIVKSDNFS